MRKDDMYKLGDVYDTVFGDSANTIDESAKSLTDKNPSPLAAGGPTTKGGFHKAIYDTEDPVCDTDEDEDNEDENDEDDTMNESKISKQTLNTTMKRTNSKSLTFDAVCKKILKENFDIVEDDDVDALGLRDATPDSEFDVDIHDDFEDSDEDSVTITIDKKVAKTLIDLLKAAVGDEIEDEVEDDIEDDSDLDFDDTEDSDEYYDEDEETTGKPALDKKKALQSKNNKVGGTVKPHKTKVSTDVTDDVGEDGDFGHAISSPKAVNMGKQNKVSNIKQGQEFFK